MENIDYVCPMPRDWDRICTSLSKEYAKTHPRSHKNVHLLSEWKEMGLPIPLILGGWSFSSDFEKANRWRDTLEWANKNNLLWVIEQTEFEKHGVIVQEDSGSEHDESDMYSAEELHEIALEHAINYLGKECIIDIPGSRGEFPDIIAVLDENEGHDGTAIQVYPTTLSRAGCDLPEKIKKRLVEHCILSHSKPAYISIGIGSNTAGRMNGEILYKTDNLLFKHYGTYIIDS